ncbi:MAG: metal-dependent hydrolase, partial [Saprospiraceae bacterium]|nr:metal-dependent hydrolase [Saprospiraceae bacterium]
MDSLTQITLGAAVGEAVLGKKVGNRAMVWGAIGGTLPDLDVLSNLTADEMSALALHRAFTHSFVFSFLAPLLLGWLVYRIYEHKGHFFSWQPWRDFVLIYLALLVMVIAGIIGMPIPAGTAIWAAAIICLGFCFFPLLAFLREKLRRRDSKAERVGWQSWAWLFFWVIFTHPLLDACTTYGTQLFQPFSDWRVAVNTISVVDPLYTLPFLICVIAASIASRQKRWRSIVNYIGIGISSAYLLFTFYNKIRVDRIFEQSLDQQQISYKRFSSSPTILNNLLWQAVAESDTAFHIGFYSILDSVPRVQSFTSVPKNHHLLEGHEEDRSVRILTWF